MGVRAVPFLAGSGRDCVRPPGQPGVPVRVRSLARRGRELRGCQMTRRLLAGVHVLRALWQCPQCGDWYDADPVNPSRHC